ncbi:MAG: hypothetical protein ACTSQI_21055 [Candidatus Helarchaeota archaeon]
MPKGKKKKKTPKDSSSSFNSAPTQSSVEIFRLGMTFENTIEYIESKVLDAFFGHICRQGEWDLAKQYIINVKEWCQMLLTTATLELTFLPVDLQEKIVQMGKKLEIGINDLLKAISTKDFDDANRNLESILKLIRELYKIRE